MTYRKTYRKRSSIRGHPYTDDIQKETYKLNEDKALTMQLAACKQPAMNIKRHTEGNQPQYYIQMNTASFEMICDILMTLLREDVQKEHRFMTYTPAFDVSGATTKQNYKSHKLKHY